MLSRFSITSGLFATQFGRLFAIGFVASAFLFFPGNADARSLSGTRATGMGDALRAAPSGEVALLVNPAGMSLHRSYVLNSLYQYRASDKGSQVNVSVVDSATKKIAAGLYYNFIHSNPSRTFYNLEGGNEFKLDQTISVHETGMALSYPLADLIYLGLTGKYLSLSIDEPEDTPDQLHESGDSGFTMDIGLIVRPFAGLNLGVVYTNAIPIDHQIYSRQLGMGIAYALGTQFLVEFDTVLDFDRAESVKASYHGGAELFFSDTFAIRGGALHDTATDSTYVTAGTGVVSRKIALDFGLRQIVDGGAETLASFSIRLFLQ